MAMPETKRCGLCRQAPSVADFHASSRHGQQAWCKPCRQAYAAAHYQANKERRQEQNKRRQAEFMAWYISLKADRPCADCGQVFHPAAMQWDHLPGFEKKANLSLLARRGGRQRVLDEIAKCELVCANCHAVRSHLRRDSVPPAYRVYADGPL
jgi:hypothetical protein